MAAKGSMGTAYGRQRKQGLGVGSCRSIPPHISTQGTHCKLKRSPSQTPQMINQLFRLLALTPQILTQRG